MTADAHQIIAAFNAHDAAAAVSHDAPNFVGMFHGAPVPTAGNLAITKMQVADPAAKVVATNETVDVGASGDLAVYRATYAYTFTDAGTKAVMTEQGNWLLGCPPSAGQELEGDLVDGVEHSLGRHGLGGIS